MKFHEFKIDKAIGKPEDGGIGTYTIYTNNDILEISGGALFQWSFIEIECLKE